MDLVAVPKRNPDVAARSIDDTFFLVNPENSELHSMNAVGQRIWELMDGARTIAAIAETVAAEYEVDPVVACEHTVEFIGSLGDKGLITVG